MTWLGKIVAVLVLLLSLVWVWLTATVYVTRTNWKTRAETYKTAYDKAVARLEVERADYATKQADLQTQLATAQQETQAQRRQVTQLTATATDTLKKYEGLFAAVNSKDQQVVFVQNLHQATLDELAGVRSRNNVLEDKQQELALARQNAERDRVTAENQARRAESLADDQAKRIEKLQEDVRDLRAGGGTFARLPGAERPPEPPPEGFKAKVIEYREGYVALSLGLDAGLQPGSILDVERLTGGGKYLGTVKVIDTGLEPKRALGTFTPMSGKPINQLKPDDLPKAGDVVRPRK